MAHRNQTLFLLALLVYDAVMLFHMHTTQTSLSIPLSQYDPIHPFLPLGDAPRPVLEMGHPWWLAAIHGMGSAIPLLGGALQISTPMRRWNLAMHRWNGRLFLLCTVGFAALPGLWMAWGIQHASAPLRIMVMGLVLIVLGASGMVWSTIRAGKVSAHRRWAIRLYASLHVIPVVARLYFWMLWVTWSAQQADTAAQWGFSTEHLTFEIIGWLTVLSVVPIGELFARWPPGRVTDSANG